VRQVKVILPPVSDDRISNDLVWLTEFLTVNSIAERHLGGLLGGEYGYGVTYENNTFMMHPFCWCDQDDCDWCLGCTCPDSAYTNRLADGTVVDADAFYDAGGYSTGTCEHRPECDYCTGRRERAANFLHKPTGSRIEWYKYIGRSMEIDIRGGWDAIFADCKSSVSGGVGGETTQ
jgi:hypothetical protein